MRTDLSRRVRPVDRAETRVAAWDRKVDLPLTVLAVLFLIGYALSVLDQSMSGGTHDALDVALTVMWVLFGVDYLIRVSLAKRRMRYIGTHLIDLVILLLPMFRQLRVLRLVTAIGVLNRQTRDDWHGRIPVYVVGATTLVCFVASLAVYDAERDAVNASITTFGDAVWWTITTISTVGYGDRYPVTFEGRVVAGTLMVAGIALLGVVTASLARWFVSTLREAEKRAEAETEQGGARTEAQLDAVLAELRALTARLDGIERRSLATQHTDLT